MLFDRPTPLEGQGGLFNWVEMFRPAVLDRIDKYDHDFFDCLLLHADAAGLLRDDQWHADYRRLRVRAIRPAD